MQVYAIILINLGFYVIERVKETVMNAMPKAEHITRQVGKAVVAIICILMFVILLYLSVISLIVTCDMNRNNGMLENIDYQIDNVAINLATLAVGLIFFFFIRKLLKKIPSLWFGIVLVILVLSFGIVWVFSAQSAPTFDSFRVTDSAYKASIGDYSGIDSDYFRFYPFQLGYVLFNEFWIWALKLSDNFLALEILNVIFLAISYIAILMSVSQIFRNDEMVKLTAILLAGCLPAVLFCTFLYGNIPGFAFAMLAVLTFLLFLERNKWYWGVLSALSIGISICIKLNNLIFFVAIFIIGVVSVIRTKKELFLRIGYLALAAAMALGLKLIPVAVYENRIGADLGEGIPMISWAAMGLSESSIECGWYSEQYTVGNFIDHDMDADAAAEESFCTIKERLGIFLRKPGYAVEFFFCKTASQWNEPSYQSLWTNQVRDHYGAIGPMAYWMLNDGEYTVKSYMNLYQQFIFVGALAAAFFCFKKKETAPALLLLIILGGFSYHLFFEAKSQYALTYFILMIPLAAYGVQQLAEKADILISKRKEKKT